MRNLLIITAASLLTIACDKSSKSDSAAREKEAAECYAGLGDNVAPMKDLEIIAPEIKEKTGQTDPCLAAKALGEETVTILKEITPMVQYVSESSRASFGTRIVKVATRMNDEEKARYAAFIVRVAGYIEQNQAIEREEKDDISNVLANMPLFTYFKGFIEAKQPSDGRDVTPTDVLNVANSLMDLCDNTDGCEPMNIAVIVRLVTSEATSTTQNNKTTNIVDLLSEGSTSDIGYTKRIMALEGATNAFKLSLFNHFSNILSFEKESAMDKVETPVDIQGDRATFDKLMAALDSGAVTIEGVMEPGSCSTMSTGQYDSSLCAEYLLDK